MPEKRKRRTLTSAKRPPLLMPIVIRNDPLHMARRGGITLVIGAGVSIPRGVPNWNDLAQAMWKKAFRKGPSPWSPECGAFRETSQFLPIIFELVYRELGDEKFIDALGKNLYANVRYPGDDKHFKRSNESLAVIARLILQEHKRKAGRRIDAVITLNADDLIEQAVHTLAGLKTQLDIVRRPIVRSVARGTHFDLGSRSRRPIPIYHIHGFLPSNRSSNLGRFDHMFVFTDAQYWSTSASALTFANRVMSSALSEGRCMFIGLSMTDINLLRWLALRTIEKDIDYNEMAQNRRLPPASLQRLRDGFARHFWIRPASDDPSGFLSRFLHERGINAVEISGWKGNDFRKLMLEYFDPQSD